MANGWAPTTPPPAWQVPPQPSGLRKAVPILLLVGGILSAVGAAAIFAMSLFMGAIFSDLSGSEASGFGPVLGIYVTLGLMALGGAVCTFVALSKANRNDLQGAFVWGLVGSLLPPVQVVTLLGAIFAKVCPEGEAQSRGVAPPQAR